MDLSYATFVPAEKTPENPKGYIDGEFHIFWKQCFSQDCTTPTLGGENMRPPRRERRD